MTRQEKIETIEKAVALAIANGYEKNIGVSATSTAKATLDHCDDYHIFWNAGKFKNGFFAETFYGVIFNHDFAKALWGEEMNQPGHWKYHLQLMVIADDPINYLQENIND